MTRTELIALRAAIDTVLAWPDTVRAEVARWLKESPPAVIHSEASKPNGRDPHPPPMAPTSVGVRVLKLLDSDVVTLWRPVGPLELELIAASGMRKFPPRLPEQPIFYPVLTEAYATKIARDWNAPRGGGFVTRFQVRRDFMRHYPVQDAGGRDHLEYWIPADDLPALNNAIVGQIEVVVQFPAT